MAEKKKIPCRVCGKFFEPCAYCQSHADVFRWRNFACSIECASKYINDTIEYRESLKNNENDITESVVTVTDEVSIEKPATARKKARKKTSAEIVENEIENENQETE